MLPEHETPDMPEKDQEVQEQEVETPASQEEQAADEVAAPTPEEPQPEPVAEAPAEEAETPPEPEASEPPAEDAAPAPEPVAEAPEPEEAPAAAEVPDYSDAPESLRPWLQRIDEVLATPAGAQHLLTQATVDDLTSLMEYFRDAEDVLPLIPKVGLIKRTFDTLKYKEEFSEADGEQFLDALKEFNVKRLDREQDVSEVRAENSRRKRELLVKLREVVAQKDPERIQDVRGIQDDWKRIGAALKDDTEVLYKEYRDLLDEFYQLREVHFELMDYDRKINLQEKERLIAEAEAHLFPADEDLGKLDVWKEKMDLLAEIQQQWKAAGHVPREDMDRVNDQYRSIIDRFFELRQGFLKILDEAREGNATQKEALLEKMAPFAEFTADRPRAWNDATRELRELQEAWKAIGQAPQRVNSALWSRYRELCNTFFSHKAEFFRKLDDERSQNLDRKRELVERAEAILQSGDWEKGAKELKQLQREWKKVGPVPERHSNKLWNRFREACDGFFEGRRTHYKDLHQDEHQNLEAKKALIEQVRTLNVEELGGREAAIQRIKELQAEWKAIGKVPYKEKDSIWDTFRGEIDAFFEQLSVRRDEVREFRVRKAVESFEEDERGGAVQGKIARLRKKIQAAQEKVDQYSININYISKGKSGDPLRKQIQDEIAKEERLIKELRKEIKLLQEALKNPPAEEAPEVVEAAEPQAETAPEAETEPEETAEAEAPAAEEAPEASEPDTDKTE